MKVKDRLTPAQYWEWRNCISTLWLKERDLLIANLNNQLIEKEIQALKLKSELVKATKVKEAHIELDSAKNEYNLIKQRLEKYLGQSLNGKVIDDMTFEIKSLDEEKET